MTSGPDDALWFVSGDASIGRIVAVGVAATAPGVPTGVTATAGDGQLTASWSAPISTGGLPLTGYTATATPGGHFCETTDDLSCTIDDLTNGTAYTVTVTATNAVGTSSPSAPSATTTPLVSFSDVPIGHPFATEIDWLASSGITSGYPDGTFRPNSAVTRQAMASFLWKYEEQPATSLTEPYFADVPSNHPFYAAIQFMAESGLSTGSPNPVGGKPLFKPNDKVSRQAMAAFLWRNTAEPAPSLPAPFFSDVDTGGTFYAPIQWMAETSLSTGTANPPGKPLYKPSDPVSRQAMAAFLYRYNNL
jgi:hypothetical protein